MNYIKEAYKKGYRVDCNGIITGPKGIERKIRYRKDGYQICGIRFSDKTYSILVHRLQAYQKYGDELFQEGIFVRHKNGVKTDNSWDNILIGTHSENMMDIPEHIRINKALYASSFNKKHDHDAIFKWYNENGRSYIKTMQRFEISSKGTLYWILKRIESLNQQL